jgi:hypothetical protein
MVHGLRRSRGVDQAGGLDVPKRQLAELPSLLCQEPLADGAYAQQEMAYSLRSVFAQQGGAS